MNYKRTLVRVEYYYLYENGLENDCYELNQISYFATRRKELVRACNDHYRKDENKATMMIYKINDAKGKILQIRHL